jgi:hypothetical protein
MFIVYSSRIASAGSISVVFQAASNELIAAAPVVAIKAITKYSLGRKQIFSPNLKSAANTKFMI